MAAPKTSVPVGDGKSEPKVNLVLVGLIVGVTPTVGEGIVAGVIIVVGVCGSIGVGVTVGVGVGDGCGQSFGIL